MATDVLLINGASLPYHLLDKGIVVRDRSRVELCEGCLRITVGTPSENKTLIRALDEFHAQ